MNSSVMYLNPFGMIVLPCLLHFVFRYNAMETILQHKIWLLFRGVTLLPYSSYNALKQKSNFVLKDRFIAL